ncbi:MAG: rhodanese-like domain-containing protein [Saprospiraceae bacterium]|nr:rhodanese-like domain-containing protein [Candidatus Vicinibacter proximus]MBL7822245.1 rhodanese-like domain-containing protein [Saprospiraceae bacterium]MCC6842997.1 rhodanese-like domain-containing protein [Saprospiraceae bacterium]HRG31895.1 rhodanese-like domain-containing protein [Saprospiraceae bacterium]
MNDISVQELNERLKKKEDFMLIDVREKHEHDEFNIGGELAPLQTSLQAKITELAGHEEDEIIVYCRSGNRSGFAKQLFEQAGFKKVRNLLGGMLAWKENIPA